jgi:hypothetical protein
MTTPSEQESGLELDREPPLDDPRGWQADDPDQATTDDRPAEQFSQPGGGGTPGDEEPDAIAEDAGTSYPAGPEHQAVRIEEEGR